MLDSRKIPRMIILRSNKCSFKLCVIKSILKLLAREDAKSHWLHSFDFSPLCVFTCVLKSPAWQDAKSHWLHLFDLSQLCIFKCLLESPACEDTKSHWLHLKTYRDIVAFARLFSIVHFQIAQQRGCITTLVAVVWFFSTVHKQTNVTIGFQMQPVWLCIFSGRWFEETFENAHWRKVKQVQSM